ncbi:tetratricopeptide repeat protein [Congregibacter brevis]|uniref:non-specific serine/threonine protein kinase n=1 Tax=Congregibacter brevis TaxID=3081201 RepID=A0ABZ0IKM3_9GAMM|nr:tetratricopeptide repeat protein [Congregibacter sp. IMCC45268]
MRPLGRGGYADVYLANDNLLERKVALKQIRFDRRTTAEGEAILAEALAASKVAHPGLVEVFDALVYKGRPTIVMEFVDGATLKISAVTEDWSLLVRVTILLKIGDAVHALHQAHIAHGDLRPENVLVTSDKRAKLLDFGISTASSHSKPIDDNIVGARRWERSRLKDIQALIDLATYTIPPKFRTAFAGSMISSLDTVNTTNEFCDCLRAIADNEAQMPTVPSRITGGPSWRIALMAVVLIIAGTLAWVWSNVKPTRSEATSVAVTETLFQDAGLLPEKQKHLIDFSLRSAVESAVLRATDLALYQKHGDIPDAERSAANIEKKGGPFSVVIKPVVECNSSANCTVVFRKETPTGKLLATTQRGPFVAEGGAALFNLAEHLISQELFHASAIVNKNSVSDENLSRYYELYVQAHFEGGSCVTIIADINLLKIDAPSFPLPYHLGAHCALEIFYETGDKVPAREQVADLLAFMLTQDNESPGNFDPVIKSFAELGDIEAAIKTLDRAKASGATWWTLTQWSAHIHYIKGEYGRAQELYQQLLDVFPAASVYTNAALAAYYNGNVESAVAIAEESLQKFPKRAKTHNFLGMMYLNQGNVESSIESLERALSLRDVTHYRSNLGLAYLISGNWEKSAVLLRAAVDSDQVTPMATLNYADALNLLGEREEAFNSYMKLTEVLSVSAPLEHQLSRAQALAHLGRAQMAINLINDLRAAHGTSSDLNYAAATVFAVAGDLNSAAAAVESAMNEGLSSHWFRFPWFDPLCIEPNLPTFGDTALCLSQVGSRAVSN